MTKLYFDNQKINTQVIPHIKKSITNLSNATYITNRISIPSDFYYKTNTIKSINNINTLTNDLKNLNNWLNSSQKEITKIMEDINTKLNEITITDIEERKNIIL